MVDRVPRVTEDVERVIKHETEVLDGCTYDSRIEIANVSDQNSVSLPIEYQVLF